MINVIENKKDKTLIEELCNFYKQDYLLKKDSVKSIEEYFNKYVFDTKVSELINKISLSLENGTQFSTIGAFNICWLEYCKIKNVCDCLEINSANILGFSDFSSAVLEPINELPSRKKQIEELEKEDELNKKRAELIKRQQTIDLYNTKGIGEVFYNATFDNYKLDKIAEIKMVRYVKLLEFLKSYKGNSGDKNIIFFGNSRNGKSHLACALVKNISGSERITLRDLYLKYLKSLEEKNTDWIIDRYSRIQFLCIDELDKTSKTEAERNFIFSIIDKRAENQRPTMLIANYNNPAMFKEVLNGQAYNRIKYTGVKKNCISFNFNEPEYFEDNGEEILL